MNIYLAMGYKYICRGFTLNEFAVKLEGNNVIVKTSRNTIRNKTFKLHDVNTEIVENIENM